MCLESGSYLLNFACCTVCGKREPLKITEKSSQEDNDGEELVTYKRGCYIWVNGLSIRLRHLLKLYVYGLRLYKERGGGQGYSHKKG